MFLSSEPRRILAWREPVDMRKSFAGLVAVVQSVLQEDPLSGTLFVFVNRRGKPLADPCPQWVPRAEAQYTLPLRRAA